MVLKADARNGIRNMFDTSFGRGFEVESYVSLSRGVTQAGFVVTVIVLFAA